MPASVTRRSLIVAALRACGAVALGVGTGGLAPRRAYADRRHRCRPVSAPGPHPDPRPGIDASHMAPAEKVRAHPDAIEAFDEARTIPEILDGIRCQCGCADQEGMRSLLSCYETEDAMAMQCDICKGEARLAFRLHGKGQSLDRIRAAIDARYGS
jgi:hypothetical protein